MVTYKQTKEFFTAIENGNLEELNRLNKEGVPWTTNDHGRTPIHAAVSANKPELIHFFHRKGCDVNAVLHDHTKDTPLHIAAKLNMPTVAEALLKCGANPNATDSEEHTPFQRGINKFHLEVLKVLRRYGATPMDSYLNLKDKRTRLHYAVSSKNVEKVKKLCAYGADVNATMKDGTAPIHYLLSLPHTKEVVEILEILDSYGADLTLKRKGVSLAETAAQWAHKDVLKYLISRGIDITEGIKNSPLRTFDTCDISTLTGAPRECVELLRDWSRNPKKYIDKNLPRGGKCIPLIDEDENAHTSTRKTRPSSKTFFKPIKLGRGN